MTHIIDGKARASQIFDDLSKAIRCTNADVKLAVIQVGNDPASSVYVKNKERAAERVRIKTDTRRISSNVSQDKLIRIIKSLNEDKSVNGILVQLPLPEHIDANAILDTIDPLKDVDGFHESNMGRLWTGRSRLVPCTPAGIMDLLKDFELAGKHALVVGRSNIVGKPIAQMLLDEDATVTLAHSKTENLDDLLDHADIVIAAVGIPEFITHCKDDAIVIDVGINRDQDGRLAGDVKRDLQCRAKTIVPGGVGPMTVAMLMKQTLDAYFLQKGI